VQNSLQLVSSFLSMQARVSDSPELQKSLEEARRRLSAVALVHHRLYRGDQVQLIDIARYIEELCADTLSSMGQEWAPHLSLDLAPVTVSTDQAIPMGLVLTELIININKFAYAGKVGPIEISLSEEANKFQLIVADRGSGKTSSRKGFGTRMMGALVSQLGGSIAYEDNQPGLRTVLTAPIERHLPMQVEVKADGHAR
jgi:chemotaxis family two-component system sensor kinase Cph1